MGNTSKEESAAERHKRIAALKAAYESNSLHVDTSKLAEIMLTEHSETLFAPIIMKKTTKLKE